MRIEARNKGKEPRHARALEAFLDKAPRIDDANQVVGWEWRYKRKLVAKWVDGGISVNPYAPRKCVNIIPGISNMVNTGFQPVAWDVW